MHTADLRRPVPHALRQRRMCHTSSMAALITVLMVLMAVIGSGCAGSPPELAPTTVRPPAVADATLGSLRLVPAFGGREFDAPTNLLQAPGGQWLVTEQAGSLWVLAEESLNAADHVIATDPVDLRGRVSSRGSEEGLLGLALDPEGDNYLYVYYSASGPRRSVISRFHYDATSGVADPASELVILEVGQPYSNHNGGQIAFGPDGYLYVGVGDGGSAGDPLGNGQDTTTLLGSILRIDVSGSAPGQPYSIPPDNPFADGGGRPEIWAYGLRNPWRFSFDRETGDLWAGDVGQNQWEEIDIIHRGGNYGWNTLEGSHCFAPREDCERDGTIPPVWEYSLDGRPCSVIGGYVYRGDAIPWLRGAYVYGDFCSGKVFALRYADGRVTEHKELADTNLRIMSFAQDHAGNLYLLSQRQGIHRLEESSTAN